MVDVPTGTSAMSNLVAAAVDRRVRAQLRHIPTLRSVVDTRPAQVDKPGSSVTLYVQPDLAVATTPLNELTDPDFVALGNPTGVQVTLNEYGNATVTSIRLRETAFSDIDPNQMDQVGWNMHNTIDTLVRDVISGGTNVTYAGNATATNNVDNADTIDSDDIRKNVTALRAAGALGKRGNLYWCGIHPDVAYDLRRESGDNGWRSAHINAAPDLIWPGEVGVYEGAFFVESARLKKAASGADLDGSGSGTTQANVYSTIIAGQEAIAEAVQIEPHVEIGVVPDKLNRFRPMGWYGLLGWNVFRQGALRRIESGSSINA